MENILGKLKNRCVCICTHICNCISLCIISYDCFKGYKPINLSHIQTPGTACPQAKNMLTSWIFCWTLLDQPAKWAVMRIFPEAGEVHSVPM